MNFLELYLVLFYHIFTGVQLRVKLEYLSEIEFLEVFNSFSDDLCSFANLFVLLTLASEYNQNFFSLLNKQVLDDLQFTFCTKHFLWCESLRNLGFNNLNVSFTILLYLLFLSRTGVDSLSNGPLVLGFRCNLYSFFDFSLLDLVPSWIPGIYCWIWCCCCWGHTPGVRARPQFITKGQRTPLEQEDKAKNYSSYTALWLLVKRG